MEYTGRGGAREGAGRKKLAPEDKGENRTVRINDKRYEKFLKLGGAKWLNKKIDEELKN